MRPRNLAIVLPIAAIYLTADTDPYRGFHVIGKPNAICCGRSDCHPLRDGDVIARPGGYFIGSKGWWVPNAEAQPGPDQHYHLCEAPPGTRRCFLTPNPGV
jgi:hypothetical protein